MPGFSALPDPRFLRASVPRKQTDRRVVLSGPVFRKTSFCGIDVRKSVSGMASCKRDLSIAGQRILAATAKIAASSDLQRAILAAAEERTRRRVCLYGEQVAPSELLLMQQLALGHSGVVVCKQRERLVKVMTGCRRE
jgi:hypothetical protein